MIIIIMIIIIILHPFITEYGGYLASKITAGSVRSL